MRSGKDETTTLVGAFDGADDGLLEGNINGLEDGQREDACDGLVLEGDIDGTEWSKRLTDMRSPFSLHKFLTRNTSIPSI
jgi:hypothetical protein